MVECLPSKHKALGLVLSSEEKKEKNTHLKESGPIVAAKCLPDPEFNPNQPMNVGHSNASGVQISERIRIFG